jgi:hypothetical protein
VDGNELAIDGIDDLVKKAFGKLCTVQLRGFVSTTKSHSKREKDSVPVQMQFLCAPSPKTAKIERRKEGN